MAAGLTIGGVDRLPLHRVSSDCCKKAVHDALARRKKKEHGSATIVRLAKEELPEKEEP